MILSEYEKLVQSVNPRLRIKRYGSSLAAVHLGYRHICRVPQGEILQNNVYEVRAGFADQYKSDFNPTGEYRFRQLTRRGRSEVARILYTNGLISFTDIPRLS